MTLSSATTFASVLVRRLAGPARRVLSTSLIPLVGLAFSLGNTFAADLSAQGSSTVSVYEDSVFRGNSVTFPLHVFPRNVPLNLSGTWEDKITSLQWNLAPGVRVTFFHDDDGDGSQYRIGRGSPRIGFDTNIGSFHNDRFSSFLWQQEDPARGILELFDDSVYRGRSDYLPLSSYDEDRVHRLHGIEDRCTSLRWSSLPANVVVTFYENADGSGREFTVMHDQPRSGGISNVGSYYNDKFSSFRWKRVDPARGWVRFFTDRAFGGYHLTRYFTSTGSWSLASEGYNDQVDSIRWSIPAGRTLMAFTDQALQGEALAMRGVGVRSDLNVSAGGRHHDRFTTYGLYDGSLNQDFSDRDAPLNESTFLSSNHAAIARARGFTRGFQSRDIDRQLDEGVRCMRLECWWNASDDTIYSTVNGQVDPRSQRQYWTPWTSTQRLRAGSPPEPLHDVVRDIAAWLADNRDEVLVIRFDFDPSRSGGGTKLGDYLTSTSCPISSELYDHRQGRWPSIREILADGKQVVAFEDATWSDDPRLMNAGTFCVENDRLNPDSLTLHGDSEPIDRRHRPLFWMNQLRDQYTQGGRILSPNYFVFAQRFGQRCNFVNIDEAELNSGIEQVRAINEFHRRQDRSLGMAGQAWSFGAGCGAAPVTAEATRAAVLLQPFGVRFGTAVTGVLFVGTSDRSFAGSPLPFRLPLGAQCLLRVTPEIDLPMQGDSFSLTVPDVTSLLGNHLFFQAVDGAQLRTTQAVAARFGRR